MSFDPALTLARLADRHGIAHAGVAPPRSHRLARDGQPTLHYLRWAEGGAPVLLLHGGALTAHTWDLVCLALAPHHACIAPDLRGHGESDWADDYAIERSVEDVVALVDALALPRVHLVGMSLGGNVAAHAAAALGPRVTSLTLVDIASRVNRDGTAVMHRFLGDATRLPSVEALVEAALAVSPRSDPDLVRYRYFYMTRVTAQGWAFRQDRRGPPNFAHMVERLAAIEQLAPTVACPFLLARGARSRVVTADGARELASRFVRGRVVTIAEAGHNVQEDNPRALAEALLAHFATA